MNEPDAFPSTAVVVAAYSLLATPVAVCVAALLAWERRS